jgi:hypothetical protein
LSRKTEEIQVHLKYKELEQQFSAEPQEAWLLIQQFFKDFIPSFEIAQKLWLSIDIQQLAKDLEGIAVFSSDGANLLVPKNKLTDNEALSLWLTAYYLGNKLGMVNSDVLSKDELQLKLGKSGKITSTRLGELVKNGLVQKNSDEKFRMTTMGVAQTQKEIVPKIKSKMKP